MFPGRADPPLAARWASIQRARSKAEQSGRTGRESPHQPARREDKGLTARLTCRHRKAMVRLCPDGSSSDVWGSPQSASSSSRFAWYLSWQRIAQGQRAEQQGCCSTACPGVAKDGHVWTLRHPSSQQRFDQCRGTEKPVPVRGPTIPFTIPHARSLPGCMEMRMEH